jgi:hypothetical protein
MKEYKGMLVILVDISEGFREKIGIGMMSVS